MDGADDALRFREPYRAGALQVISAAKQALFITSFAAHDVSTIAKALNDASTRGVSISMLLESSQDHGGSMSFDVIGKMRTLVPTAKLYACGRVSVKQGQDQIAAAGVIVKQKTRITAGFLTILTMEAWVGIEPAYTDLQSAA